MTDKKLTFADVKNRITNLERGEQRKESLSDRIHTLSTKIATHKAESQQQDDSMRIPAKKLEEVKIPPQESAKAAILRQFGGLESNIPVNSGYWHMK